MVISKDDLPRAREEADSLTDRPRAQADPPVVPRANSSTDGIGHDPDSKTTTPGARQAVKSVASTPELYGRRRRRSRIEESTPYEIKALRGMIVVLAAWFFLLRVAARSSTSMIVLHGFFLVVIVCWSGLAAEFVRTITRTCIPGGADQKKSGNKDESFEIESQKVK